jgi:hypothetical protein
VVFSAKDAHLILFSAAAVKRSVTDKRGMNDEARRIDPRPHNGQKRHNRRVVVLRSLSTSRLVTRLTVPLPTFNELTVGPPERIHRYALDASTDFAVDVERWLHEIAWSKSEYAVLVNPNNPAI